MGHSGTFKVTFDKKMSPISFYLTTDDAAQINPCPMESQCFLFAELKTASWKFHRCTKTSRLILYERDKSHWVVLVWLQLLVSAVGF
jgi:hypothetical protein